MKRKHNEYYIHRKERNYFLPDAKPVAVVLGAHKPLTAPALPEDSGAIRLKRPDSYPNCAFFHYAQLNPTGSW